MENPSALLLVPTLFLHLGILKPPLIGERLNVGDELEQDLGFIEFAFSLCEVSQVKQDLPMHLLGNVDDALKHEFYGLSEALLLHILQVSRQLLMLVLGHWSLNEFLLQLV